MVDAQPVFNGTWKSTAVLTRARQWSRSWTTWIRSTLAFFKIQSPKWSLPLRVSKCKFCAHSHLFHACYMPCPFGEEYALWHYYLLHSVNRTTPNDQSSIWKWPILGYCLRATSRGKNRTRYLPRWNASSTQIQQISNVWQDKVWSQGTGNN
jgi:hypothetical protein